MSLESPLVTRCLLLTVSFLCGSLPFSVWIGQLALRKDIRQYGDQNPGATNVFRAGGKGWGVAAFLLDTFKATLPVGFAYYILGIDGWWMVAIAVAPVLGHAFSPFLRLRGGKAVAAAFGMWMGLTIGEVPTVSGLLLLYWFKVIDNSGWAVLFTLGSLLGYLLLAHPTPLFLAVWAGSGAIVLWKHRAELKSAPQIREDAWVRRLFRK
ncbi:MAG: glycerol-3-phosphate acyltransferase [Anaerolineae bacterium]